jgi:hypothetical protein
MTIPFSLGTHGVGKLVEGQNTTPETEQDVDGALTNFANADNTDGLQRTRPCIALIGFA